MQKPILLALMLALFGCHKDKSFIQQPMPGESVRVEKEVARRVEAAKLESTVRTSRFHTIRVIGFIVLAGGAVAGLCWIRQPQSSVRPTSVAQIQGALPPLWNDHQPPRAGRVIDFPPVTVSAVRQPARQPNSRNRNRRYQDETPARS